MKVHINSFLLYASRFTLKSMVTAISYWAFYLISHPSKSFRSFADIKHYTVFNGNKKIKGRVTLYQTNLIDVMYQVIKYGHYGNKEITLEEALYLIHLHVNADSAIHSKRKNHTDFMLSLFGDLGEQEKFQSVPAFFDDFAREKYILETISQKAHQKNQNKIDFKKEFVEETSLTTDEYSTLIYVLFAHFSTTSNVLEILKLKTDLKNSFLSKENIENMLKRYSITAEEVRTHKFERQVFYQKPILEIDGSYVPVNPFLLLCTFVNSNYWVIRNKYLNAKTDKQKFINAFGKYFEIYVEEILENCLSAEQYENIEETDKGKRADWHLKIGPYDFLIEQKSTISMLQIKQSNPDIEKMKSHICNTWGEAVKQLKTTQDFYNLKDPIKIILVYEDYYNSLCLDFLFELNPTLIDDNNYWLVSIQEFERLMYTYKTEPEKFFKIVEEKVCSEKTKSKDGRDLSKFLSDNGVFSNLYLDEYKISDEFKKIEALTY